MLPGLAADGEGNEAGLLDLRRRGEELLDVLGQRHAGFLNTGIEAQAHCQEWMFTGTQ